ncbi:site-specific DNA-methyltransferase [Rhodanobacter thiooxydans]|uniref:site-specific DNA-methyltransferase n=1 Tax=Rhodanobacter thiooxydans TaxID=416169 RepID=UPI0002D994C7|nr:site-specific DNA-methyltransferase [Rhodanobacter thiooxydans]
MSKSILGEGRRLSSETPNGHTELLKQLRELLPAAFLDGELDRTALLDALGPGEEREPAFAFSWPGMEQARRDARAPTTATLVPDVRASVHWEDARDVLIEGDNLQVLKLLKNGYAGAFKLIYIDPPYNTGDTFTYNDDFSVPEAEYLRATGQVDDQGATTSRKETKGRKHAPWLTMMFPRLTVARHLLRKDGVFLASIDNNEVHHLRLLLDAVFGAENFVDMMTWRGARKGDAKLMGGGQDYILVYARNKSYLAENDIRWREKKDGLGPIYVKVDELFEKYGEDYSAATEELKSWYKSLPDEDPSKSHAHYCVMDKRGAFFPGDISSPNPRPNLVFDWKGYSVPKNGWRYELAKMKELDKDGRLLYPDSKDKRIQVKRYLREHEEWAPASVFYRDRRAASGALKKLMGAKVFDDPKGADVLARLFHAITDDDDLILDFFAGSGSTGQAVWEQNPRDGKTRHWVLVQRPEKPDETTETGRNAVAEGYDTIFEITAERLRRAAEAIGGGLGFRVFRARETGLAVEAPVVARAGQGESAQYTLMLTQAGQPPVKDGASPDALAWEVALKASSTRLDETLTRTEADGATVYTFRNSAGERLLVCLDRFTSVTAAAVELRETGDDTLVLRGDRVDDALTLTLAPRLRSKLIMLERMTHEVSI